MYRPIKNVCLNSSLVLALAVAVFVRLSAADSPVARSEASAGKLNSSAQASSAPDAATKILREGRDLIDGEQWAKAVEKFQEVINQYRGAYYVDAALYWLAFALKKQNKLQEADKVLQRLTAEFPDSEWVDDARSMRIEMAPQLGAKEIVSEIIGEEVKREESDEIKIVALQGLFGLDPERAATLASNLLRPESRASRRVKEAAILLLGKHGGEPAASVLADVARRDPNTDVRRTAIYWLSKRADDTTVNELTKIYDAAQDIEIKNQIIFALSKMKSELARDKIVEIARTADNIEVRKQAVFWIGKGGDEKAIEHLIALYDAEKSEEVKEQIIFSLAKSEQKPALWKLMEIARSDPSLELRKRAIFWIAKSKDPETARFLEEILK